MNPNCVAPRILGLVHASGFRPKKRIHGRSSPYSARGRAGRGVLVDVVEGVLATADFIVGKR